MFRDGMRLNLDDLAFVKTFCGAFTNPLLQALDQALVLLHRPCPHGHMVVFGEHPGIEIRGNVGTDVHLSQILVIGHFLRRKLDPLLKGDGNVVIAGIHGFGHPGIGAIGTDDQIHIQRLLFPGWSSATVIGVMDGVGTLSFLTGINPQNKAVDQRCAEVCSAIPEEGIKNLSTAHADVGVVVISERIKTDINFTVGR